MIRFDGFEFVNDVDVDAAEVVKEIRQYAKHLLDSYVTPYAYSAAEMASWTELLSEAKAYQQSNDPADAPLCNAEASASGVHLSYVVSRVTQNATAYQDYLTAVKGARNKHLMAISQITGDAANAYDWRAGWP